MLVNLIFRVAIIFLAVWLFQALFSRDRTASSPSAPLEVLKHRYAAGEIDREDSSG
jgi:putative membrane protein